MENPGLKRHISDQRAPYLKVTSRRTATTNPPMPAPHTKTIDGYQTGIEDTYGTQRENVTTPPPLMGGSGQMPVPATNGEYGQDRIPNLEHLEVWGGAGVTLVPGETRQKGNPTAAQPLEQMSDPNPAADERRKQQQKQVGGGEKENPAYDQAQDRIREKLQLRRAHPLFKGAELYEESKDPENGLVNYRDTDYPVPPPPEGYGVNWTAQPMFSIKDDNDPSGEEQTHGEVCETCYLRHGWPGGRPSNHRPEDKMDHVFKPMSNEGMSARFSARQAAFDPARGEWLYEIDKPDYHVLGEQPPSAFSDSAQKMFQLKKLWDGSEGEGEDIFDAPHYHRGYPVCETCAISDPTGTPHPPGEGRHHPEYGDHEYNPVEELPPGVRLANAQDDEWWSQQPDVEDTGIYSDYFFPGSIHQHGPSCETCYLKDGVQGVDRRYHDAESRDSSEPGHPFKPLTMEPGQRFSAWDPEREQFLYRIENGPNYYLNDPPPSRNSPTNQDMLREKRIYDGTGEDTPDVLDHAAWRHPSWPACQGCVDEGIAPSEHPKSKIHTPDSRDTRAHKYQPVEDLPSGTRLAALEDRNIYPGENWKTFIDTDIRPDPNNLWNRHGDQPMIDFKHDYSPRDEEQILEPGFHWPQGGHTCETCYMRSGDEMAEPENHEATYGHQFKPLKMEPGQRYSAYDHVRQEWLYDIDNPNYFKEDRAPSASHYTSQPMYKVKNDIPDYRFGDDIDEEETIEPYLERWNPNETYSETQDSRDKRENLAREGANQGSPDDPIYPFKGWGNGEPEDTVDEHNLQEGDDSFRPHHPLVDRVMNHLQGLPDVSRGHPLMENVNKILDEGPEEGSDALAGGLNTIFDSMRETEGMSPEERLQHAKDAIDLHIETGKLTHKEHVKRLREDWEARGGRKTGEPVPVESFSARYTHPDGQYIVPDPNNPFPQSTSVIRPKGKCKGCGRQTFMDDAHDMSDPRGPIGVVVSDPMRAADYDMHGPDLPACFDCQNDYDRYNRILDKGKGHKAGEPSGGFHWEWQRQPDGTQRNVRVDHTHYKDKKGIWHHPGEQAGSCPDCGPDAPPDLRTAHHNPTEDMKDVLAIQGSPGNWDYDEYMHGMFNGMELMDSIHNRRDPEFREAPGMWGRERAALRQKQKPTHRESVMPKAAGLKKRGESDEEFWARMEREYPGQQNTSPLLHSPDQAGMEFDDEGENYRDPELDWDDDDLDTPENMSLRDHARLLRSGVFRWDGSTRYPKYTHEIHREIRDSEGNRAHAIEGQVIEHNSHHRGPVLPSSDNPNPHPLEYPWQHTYYPAGVRDEEGLVRGYNSPDEAMAAANQLALWGPRHRDSAERLKGYQYNYSELPYDPSVELPHEKAMHREAGFKEQWKDAFGDLVDWSRGWNADLYDVLRLGDQLKALGDPDFYDEHGNLIHKGAEPRVRPARPITIREMVKKPRDPRPKVQAQPQFPEQHLIDPGRPLANPGRPREPRPLANPGRSRVAAWDDSRGEFLYNIEDPDYYKNDSPPSIWGHTKQPMFEMKDFTNTLDGYQRHPDHPYCKKCFERDDPAHPPTHPYHDREHYNFSHEFDPMEDTPSGVRLANA